MKFRTTIFTILLAVSSLTKGRDASFSIEVIPRTREIHVGQPFSFQVEYKFKEPQISSDNGQVRKYFRHYAYLDIEHEKQTFSTMGYKLFPMDLKLGDTRGTKYQEYFICFYEPAKERLLFPVPGKYTIKVRGWGNSSEPLTIHVKGASQVEQQALSLLSDPNDFIFLEGGEHDYSDQRPERMAHLKKVVEQCEDTLLAKWSAGRLGVEYFKDFHEKHPSFQKFQAKYRDGEIEEPLFDRASMYLAMGTGLPDEFAIRENVLFSLSRAEFIKGDYEKAASLLDELAAKYPHGEYGKRATRAKAELLELQKRKPVQAPRPWVSGWSRLLPLFFVIAAGIFLIAYLLVVKKRASSLGK